MVAAGSRSIGGQGVGAVGAGPARAVRVDIATAKNAGTGSHSVLPAACVRIGADGELVAPHRNSHRRTNVGRLAAFSSRARRRGETHSRGDADLGRLAGRLR